MRTDEEVVVRRIDWSVVDYIEKRDNMQVVAAAKHCLDLLCDYAAEELPHMLDKKTQTEFEESGQAFCDWARAGMVGLILERFFCYHLLRELITTSEMRGYAANAIFHCLRWLSEQKLWDLIQLLCKYFPAQQSDGDGNSLAQT